MSSETKKASLDFIQMALTLFAITAVVAVLLALANSLTAPIIEKSAQERLNQSLNSLMEEAVTFEEMTEYSKKVHIDGVTVPIVAAYQGRNQSEEVTGYCIHVAPTGYSDAIEMMVAVNGEGAVSGVQILSISDTPGIGMKVQSDAEFQNSLLGLSEQANIVKSAPQKPTDIQVISGASISSAAYINGVNAALETAQVLMQEVES